MDKEYKASDLQYWSPRELIELVLKLQEDLIAVRQDEIEQGERE